MFRLTVTASTVTQVHDHLVNTASKSEHGRGGMAAKITAAWMAAEHGCTTVILNGKKPDGILQVCKECSCRAVLCNIITSSKYQKSTAALAMTDHTWVFAR